MASTDHPMLAIKVGDDVDIIEANRTVHERVKVTGVTKTLIKVGKRKFRRVPAQGRRAYNRRLRDYVRTGAKRAGVEIAGFARIEPSDEREKRKLRIEIGETCDQIAECRRLALAQLRAVVALLDDVIPKINRIMGDADEQN